MTTSSALPSSKYADFKELVKISSGSPSHNKDFSSIFLALEFSNDSS
jgi:hypothetical protein